MNAKKIYHIFMNHTDQADEFLPTIRSQLRELLEKNKGTVVFVSIMFILISLSVFTYLLFESYKSAQLTTPVPYQRPMSTPIISP